MRQRRLKAPASFLLAHYHCMSRVVNRDFVFGPEEREYVSANGCPVRCPVWSPPINSAMAPEH